MREPGRVGSVGRSTRSDERWEGTRGRGGEIDVDLGSGADAGGFQQRGRVGVGPENMRVVNRVARSRQIAASIWSIAENRRRRWGRRAHGEEQEQVRKLEPSLDRLADRSYHVGMMREREYFTD